MFEKVRGSGVWWIMYYGREGRRHREKVGPKALAVRVYAKRRTEIAEGRFFPEDLRRRDVLVAEHLKDYVKNHVEGRSRYPAHARR